MDDQKDIETEIRWKEVLIPIEKSFGEIDDLKDVVFLIGIQELGQGFRKLTKDEKIDVMHIGVCKLLGQFGYYEFSGHDRDGWPHWNLVKALPFINENERETLLKKAVIEYFEKSGLI